MVWKQVNRSSPGTASTVGSDDIDKYSKLFAGVSNVDTVDINSTFGMRHGKARITNSSGVNPIILNSAATTSRTQTFPDETGTIVTDVSAITLAGIQTLTGAKTFLTNTLKLRNPLNSFSYTLVHGPITADRNITLPNPGVDADFVLTAGTQTITGAKNFNSDMLRVWNPIGDKNYQFVGSALAVSVNVTLPLLTASDTFVFQAHPQLLTNKTADFDTGLFRIFNPAKTFRYIFQGSAITGASKNVTLPLLTADDTFLMKGFADTITGAKTFADQTLKLRNSANTFSTTLRASVGTGDFDLLIPQLSATDTVITAAPGVSSQTISGQKNFVDDKLTIWNPAQSSAFRFRTSAITTGRDVTLPLLLADDTFVFKAHPETITGAKSFSEGTLKVLNTAGNFAATIMAPLISGNKNYHLPQIAIPDINIATLEGGQTFTGIKTFMEGMLKVRNTADTFSATINAPDILAAKTYNLPHAAPTINNIATLEAAQTFTGAKTFEDNDFKLRNPADTFSLTVTGGAQTANRTISFPAVDQNDVVAVLTQPQTNSGAMTYLNNTLKLRNPANTFSINLVHPPITTSDKNLTIPAITADDTIAVLGKAQTFTSNIDFTGANYSTGNSLFAHNKLRIEVSGGTGAGNFISFNVPTLTTSMGVNFPNLTAGDTFLFKGHPDTVTGAKTFAEGMLKINNTLGTLAATINAPGLTLNRTFEIPNVQNCEFIMANGGQNITGAKSFSEGTLKVLNTAGTFAGTINAPALTSARIWNLPNFLGTMEILTDLGTQIIKGIKTFEDNNLRMYNPLATASYIFKPSAITSSKNVFMPLLTTDDQFTFDNHPSTLKGKTIDALDNPILSSVNTPDTRKRIGGWFGGNATAGFGFANGLITSIGTATSHVLGTSAGKCLTHVTAATIDAQAGMRGGAGCGVMRTALARFKCWFRITTPYTNRRTFIGLQLSTTAFRTGDDPLNGQMGIMLCARSTDTTYQIAHNDSTDVTVFEDTGVATANSSMHLIEIKSDAADTGWQWSLDGSAFSALLTTDVPASTTQMFPVIEIETTEALAKNLDLAYWFAEHTDLA
jgi:hypothetical protein